MEVRRIVIDDLGEREVKMSAEKIYPWHTFVAARLMCSNCSQTYYAACKTENILEIAGDECCPFCNKLSDILEEISLGG